MPAQKQYSDFLCTRCETPTERYSATQRYCKTCVRDVERDRSQKAYARRRGGEVRQKDKPCTCQRCKAEFIGRGGGDLFCLKCLPLTKREWRWQNYRSKASADGSVLLGAQISCTCCGLKVVRTSGTRRYCKTCSDKAKTASRSEASRRYKSSNALEIARRDRDRWINAPTYALNKKMGSAIRNALRERDCEKTAPWTQLVGYSPTELATHLERQFHSGMSWANFGEWHVDHIVPKSSFAYKTTDDPEFRAAWALCNLRPLWALDNLTKGAKRLLLI